MLFVLFAKTQEWWVAEHFGELPHHLNLKQSRVWTGFIGTVVGVVEHSSEIAYEAGDGGLPDHVTEISRSEKGWS